MTYNDIIDMLNSIIYAPQDYALIRKKVIVEHI